MLNAIFTKYEVKKKFFYLEKFSHGIKGSNSYILPINLVREQLIYFLMSSIYKGVWTPARVLPLGPTKSPTVGVFQDLSGLPCLVQLVTWLHLPIYRNTERW